MARGVAIPPPRLIRGATGVRVEAGYTKGMRMKIRRHLAGVVVAAIAVVAAMSLPAIASAHSGEYSKFDQCPSTNPAVKKCLYSVVTGGEFVLGKKKTPIV